MKTGRILWVVISILFHSHAHAGKIEKAFEKLQAFDYFNAKKYFEKALKRETPAAAFGLATIYSRNDNPFYNTDEARHFVLMADSTYRLAKEKTKRYYFEFGVSDSAILRLSQFICSDAFRQANEKSTVEGYNHYIRNFSTCSNNAEAYLLRDSAAFRDAGEENTSTAYKAFLAAYPQSQQYAQAADKYELCIYRENTTEGNIESYENFIRNFPENKYRQDAEEKLYALSVPDKTLEQYLAFARNHASSSFARAAWKEIYKLSMKDYSMESYNNFKDSFPDYPFVEEFENDFRLQNYIFLPFKEDGNWGYLNEYGKEMIEPVYEEASLFSDGLAAVAQQGLYGYISKSGNLVINYLFKDAEPFHNGFAVVMKDSLYGLINKKGEFIIQALYDELSETEDDLFIAAKNEKYGYVRRNGVPLTAFTFDIASDFRNHKAVVSLGEKSGLIDEQGRYIINPVFDELVFISDSLLKAMNEEELWGIIDAQGDTILPFDYEAIGEFGDGLALVARQGKCGYVDKTGSVVIPLKFIYSTSLLTTGQFLNGYALLKQKYTSALIDRNGEVIKFKGYDDYKRPASGLVPVRKQKRWGFTDLAGRNRIPCIYESVESFSDTLAIIRKGSIAGLIDTTGRVFIQPLYQDIKVLQKAILVESNNKWGLLSESATLYLPCNYESMELIAPQIIRAGDDRGFTYVNLQSGKIIFIPRD
jgi:hypothetical protein